VLSKLTQTRHIGVNDGHVLDSLIIEAILDQGQDLCWYEVRYV